MKKILVVDDEFDIRTMLDEFLSINNFEVKKAEDGQVALKIFDDFKPDLAIVDIKMPVLDGPGFSKKILEKHPDFPIIIITGYAAHYNINEIIEIGIKKIIPKPLEFETLFKIIQQYLP